MSLGYCTRIVSRRTRCTRTQNSARAPKLSWVGPRPEHPLRVSTFAFSLSSTTCLLPFETVLKLHVVSVNL